MSPDCEILYEGGWATVERVAAQREVHLNRIDSKRTCRGLCRRVCLSLLFLIQVAVLGQYKVYASKVPAEGER